MAATNSQDNAGNLNTDTGTPPRLDFTRRFIYDAWNKVLKEVERQTTSVLMTPLMMPRERVPRMLSNIGKETPAGDQLQGYENKLPKQDVAAAMIAQSTRGVPIGAGPANEFPFKLAAVGRVNGMDILMRAGQPGELVSRTVEIIP